MASSSSSAITLLTGLCGSQPVRHDCGCVTVCCWQAGGRGSGRRGRVVCIIQDAQHFSLFFSPFYWPAMPPYSFLCNERKTRQGAEAFQAAGCTAASLPASLPLRLGQSQMLLLIAGDLRARQRAGSTAPHCLSSTSAAGYDGSGSAAV